MQVLAHLISCLVVGLLGDGAPLWGSVTRFKWRSDGHANNKKGSQHPTVTEGQESRRRPVPFCCSGAAGRGGEESRGGAQGRGGSGKARQGKPSKEAHVSKVGREERRQGGSTAVPATPPSAWCGRLAVRSLRSGTCS